MTQSQIVTSSKGLSFWDQEIHAPTHTQWMALPVVRHYINTRISGPSAEWPMDWFERSFPGTHFQRALSVGCGAGALERDLIRRNLCESIDAFDGSMASLAIAREEAIAEGMAQRIRYFAWDFNEPSLPRGHYDAVFVHQALHHVAKLEKLLRAILLSLKPSGMLYLDEYIGPSRTHWSPANMTEYVRYYDALPREVRFFDAFPQPVQQDDPTEAIRSGEIMEQLRIGFDVTAIRGYGGNLLGVIFPGLMVDRLSKDLVARMIADEQGMLDRGDPDFHAVIVARPRKGVSARLANARYFVEPKLKRIGREIRSRVRW